MTSIRIDNVSKRFDSAVAVDRVRLDVAAGELFFLLGPSGCGKTTLLRILAGFVQPDAGEVYFDKRSMNPVPPRGRNTGMVFQSYALWPHLTVAQNVAYGLEVRRLPRAKVRQRVQEVLELVRMESLADRRPNQLSGGQQQRVALARALVVEPAVLLLDEPLSNLDAQLRIQMREEIRRIHDQAQITTVYVTHDQKEALALADRIAVMCEGRIAQVGTPTELYTRPAGKFVAQFLGETNLISGRLAAVDPGGTVRVETELGTLSGTCYDEGLKPGGSVLCSIRPESWSLPGQGPGDTRDNRIEATLRRKVFLGELSHLHFLTRQGPLTVFSSEVQAGGLQPGRKMALSVDPKRVVVFAEP